MKNISCKEATLLILKKEEGRLSLIQRLSLSRHLLICSLCRIFSAQNNQMNEAMKKRSGQLKLSEGDKKEILRSLLKQGKK